MENQNLPLEKELEPIFSKIPGLPENIKDLLIQIAPWLAALVVVLGGLSFLSLIGLGSAVSALGYNAYGSTWNMWLSILAMGASAVLCLLAFKPLQNKERKGWNYLYYTSLIGLASNVLSLSLFAALLGGFISFYILFQVKKRYLA